MKKDHYLSVYIDVRILELVRNLFPFMGWLVAGNDECTVEL